MWISDLECSSLPLSQISGISGNCIFTKLQISLPEGEAEQPVRGEPQSVWAVDDEQSSNIPGQPPPRRPSYRADWCSGRNIFKYFHFQIFSRYTAQCQWCPAWRPSGASWSSPWSEPGWSTESPGLNSPGWGPTSWGVSSHYSGSSPSLQLSHHCLAVIGNR